MSKQKKPYQKPEITVHHPGSPAYDRFMKLLEEESKQVQEITQSLSQMQSTPSVSAQEESHV